MVRLEKIIGFTLAFTMTSGCYVYNFFKDDTDSTADVEQTSTVVGGVLGRTLGNKTNGFDSIALAEVHAVSSTHAPALIRPDPDTFVRNLLRSFRSEGMTLARQIGEIEDYRSLLGGANQDFSKDAAKDYDATSLLSTMKVAEVVCEGLVAPSGWRHSGWETILPHSPENWNDNILYLAQRILGQPSSNIDSSVINDLKGIMDVYSNGETYSNNSYVPVCTALAVNAEALYL
jgi:hypothetical protein